MSLLPSPRLGLVLVSGLIGCSNGASSESKTKPQPTKPDDSPATEEQVPTDAGSVPSATDHPPVHPWMPCEVAPTRAREGTSEPIFNQDLVRTHIRKHMDRIRHCYEKELLVKPELSGKLTVRAWIESGKVTRAVAAGIDTKVASCVRDTFLDQMTFPSTISGPLGYPLVFRPAGEEKGEEKASATQLVFNENKLDAELRTERAAALGECLADASRAGQAGRVSLLFEVDEGGKLAVDAHADHGSLQSCLASAAAKLEPALDPNEFRRFSCATVYGDNTVPEDAPRLHLNPEGVTWGDDDWGWKRIGSKLEKRSEQAAVELGLVTPGQTGLPIVGVDPRKKVVILRIEDDVSIEDIGRVMRAFHYPPMWSYVLEARDGDSWIRLHQPVVSPDVSQTVLLAVDGENLWGWVNSIYAGHSSKAWTPIDRAELWRDMANMVAFNETLASLLEQDRASIKLWHEGRFGDIRQLVRELGANAGTLTFADVEPSPWHGMLELPRSKRSSKRRRPE